MYSNTNLEKLSLKYNNIGVNGLIAIAECLQYNNTIVSIYLWGNNFDQAANMVI